MDVIINSDCSVIPQHSKLLTSEGTAVLNLLHSMNYDVLAPPVADVLRRSLHLEGTWCILSPVYWQATHNDAMITAANEALQLDEEKAGYCFQSYAEYLAEEGMQLHYYDATTWLLQITDKAAIHAKPVHKLLNHSLMPELAHLDPSMYWQKFFTEGQMFFASCTNQSAINGVWPWGATPLSGKKTTKISADESLLPIAQACSDNVTRYDPTASLKQNSILLLSHINVLSKHHQEELKKLSVRWYWNNSAYSTNGFYWFTRLWRTLIHAD